MAPLRVFLSSTCYDLSTIRSQIRGLIRDLGHEPVMSEFSEVLYDPSEHTHESCIKEVATCDMLVLVIGSRFGGTGIPTAVETIDFEKLREGNFSPKSLLETKNLSVTQLEVCRAIEAGVPVFAFVTEQVWHDHRVYESNKEGDVADKIRYPSIEKPETARYIFEFLNFLRGRSSNNSITPFSRIEEIDTFIKRQWSALLQRLLQSQRRSAESRMQIEMVSAEIADLKAALISSISAPDLKATARGAIRFRLLLEFLASLSLTPDLSSALMCDDDWHAMLRRAGIVRVAEAPQSEKRRGFRPADAALICEDGTYYAVRFSGARLDQMQFDWEAWRTHGTETKQAIADAVLESGRTRPPIARHISSKYEDDVGADCDGEIDETEDLAG